MYKTKRILQVLIGFTFLCCSLICSAYTAIDFDNANNLMHDVRSGIDNKNTKVNALQEMLSNIKVIHYQASHCVQDEKKQLDNIAALEANNEIPELTDKNSKDAIYIQNKKKKHYEKASKCRLLAFKTQDLTIELSDAISNRKKGNLKEGTLIEKISNIITSKKNSAPALGALILFSSIFFAFKIAISHGRILRGIYLKKNRKHLEIQLLNFSLYFLIICWLAIFVFQLFEFPSVNINKTIEFILNGATFYSFKRLC